MPIDAKTSFLIILLVALTTFGTRVFPFLFFPKEKKIPDQIRYLGKVLTPAIIGMLVVYCLRNVKFTTMPFGLPELLAVFLTIGLHVWKRNNLLSIGAGTIFYMFLVQTNVINSLFFS